MQGVRVLGEKVPETLVVKPLGGGQEVGRSCILLSYMGKNILLDCGIHPGMTGVDALPFVDLIECENIDLLLITHFHLDHCGALPWFLEKTTFRGRCFMTHATKAIYRMILSDYIKVSNISADHMLYSESDLENSMSKIEVMDFREHKSVDGINFKCYVAGHVLGACMFMIEIAGVKILYTGDFSRLEDRHLCAAEMPEDRPDVLILESTYGTQVHENRHARERRFRQVVKSIVCRGGRCLIPVFALGRAQELLLILDEFWASREELSHIPIYYASSLAKRCMSVYQTFISGMNSTIQQQIAFRNPFNFQFVKYLPSVNKFVDSGPCVVLASPGMLQSGLSRELFESWCSDPKNGCIIAGYCVEGTLAKHILTEPDEVMSMSGQKLPVRMDISYISFSAHTDFQQTSEFIRLLAPRNVIFVHGESNEMTRLRVAIDRQYGDGKTSHLTTYTPRNTEEVRLSMRHCKCAATAIGRITNELRRKRSGVTSGLLVKRNFNCRLIDPKDLKEYTDVTTHVLMQRVQIKYDGKVDVLNHYLRQFARDEILPTVESGGRKALLICRCVKVFINLPSIILEWESDMINDIISRGVMSVIYSAGGYPVSVRSIPLTEAIDYGQYTDLLITFLRDLVDETVERTGNSEELNVTINEANASIDLSSWDVKCQDADVKSFFCRAIDSLKKSLLSAPERVSVSKKEEEPEDLKA